MASDASTENHLGDVHATSDKKSPAVTSTGETRIDAPHVIHSPDASLRSETIEVSDASRLVSSGATVARDSSTRERADPAESISASVPPSGFAAALNNPSSLVGQLRTQANQLGEYLRSRQRDLDHREAQLNAHQAQLENDLREARLWARERCAEIEHREQSIVRRETQLEEQIEHFQKSRSTLDRELAEVQRRLLQQHAALCRSKAQLDAWLERARA